MAPVVIVAPKSLKLRADRYAVRDGIEQADLRQKACSPVVPIKCYEMSICLPRQRFIVV
jgi:hypothetical protein